MNLAGTPEACVNPAETAAVEEKMHLLFSQPSSRTRHTRKRIKQKLGAIPVLTRGEPHVLNRSIA